MFDVKNFKNILKKAIGKRTITDYSKECQVNRTYISKYINERLQSPPAPDVLKRLSDYADNGISYEDFMAAAGYLNKNNNDNSQIDFRNENDVGKILNKTLKYIESQDSLTLNGIILTREDLNLLNKAIKDGIEYTKIASNKNKK